MSSDEPGIFQEFWKSEAFRNKNLCRTRPNQEFGFELSRFPGCPSRVRWNSFLIDIRGLADVGELGAGFRSRRVRRDKVAGKASRSVSRASPGTENEGRAFRHVVGVA